MPSPIVRRDVQLWLGGDAREANARRSQSQPALNYLEQLPPEVTPPRRRGRGLPSSQPLRRGPTVLTSTVGLRPPPSRCLETRSLPPPSPTREDLTGDLEWYLSELRGRRDEDGLPSVVFPSNYEAVVSVMGRADLTPSLSQAHPSQGQGSENPQDVPVGEGEGARTRSWSHYVLEDGLPGSAGEGEVDGTILRGLAKIKQLDLQLLLKGREERSRRLEQAADLDGVRDDLRNLIQSMRWDSIPRKNLFLPDRTPHHGASSERSRTPNQHGASESTSTRESESVSPPSTSRTTMSDVVNGRTTFLTDGMRDKSLATTQSTSLKATSLQSKSHGSMSGRLSARSHHSGSEASTRHSGASGRGHGERDFIQDNKELAKNKTRRHLTPQDEERYRELLQVGDHLPSPYVPHEGPETSDSPAISSRTEGGEEGQGRGGESARGSEYGFGDGELERLRRIDAQLQSMASPAASRHAFGAAGSVGEGRAAGEEGAHKGEGEEGKEKGRRGGRSESARLWDDALDSLHQPQSVGVDAFRAYLHVERERRHGEIRMLQIDAMLDELHRIAPLPSAPPSLCDGGEGVRSVRPPATPARSEASEAIALHSARSVRRPIERQDIEAVVSETKRQLGEQTLSETDRGKVTELLVQLKALGVNGESVIKGQELLDRVFQSIQKSAKARDGLQRIDLSRLEDHGSDSRPSTSWCSPDTTTHHSAVGPSPPSSPSLTAPQDDHSVEMMCSTPHTESAALKGEIVSM